MLVRCLGAGLCAILIALALASPSRADFLLSDPDSEVYYRFALVSDSLVFVEMGGTVVGDLHSNGTISLKSKTQVTGDVAAVGTVVNLGTVSGTLTQGAPALPLPALLDEAAMRTLAARSFEHDVVFTNTVIDDVVFVAGSVTISGSLDGAGTILALGDVNLRASTVVPQEGSKLSIVSLANVKLGGGRRLRGVIQAAGEIVLEQGAAVEGVLVAGYKVLLKRQAQLAFRSFDEAPPMITVTQPGDGVTVREALLSATGTAVDPSGVTGVTVAGVPAQLAGASFSATVVLAGDSAATAFSGVVLDNALTPIPGAVVSATAGEVTVSTTTDAEGHFRLVGVPVGAIHLHVDPTLSPRPETFPPLAFETVTIAGAENDLGRPILIPPLDTASTAIVGGPEDVTLEMAGVEGLTLTVLANSVTCPDGSGTCPVTLSQVHLDKLPMPPRVTRSLAGIAIPKIARTSSGSIAEIAESRTSRMGRCAGSTKGILGSAKRGVAILARRA